MRSWQVFAAYPESAGLSPVSSDGQVTQALVLGSTFCSASFSAPQSDSQRWAPDWCWTEQTTMVTPDTYTSHQCVLGIAEGVAQLGLGKVTPLEYNLDYLHGVSFHKGCYIGQELTARTHHTGVIRKRILPLQFRGQLAMSEGEELSVVNDKGKNVGKVKKVMGDIGMGLMRLKESFEAEKLLVNNVEVVVSRPGWWPQDKDVASTSNSSS